MAKKQSLTGLVREKLDVDSVSVRDGVVTVRDEFFYSHGRTSEDFVRDVLKAFPDAIVRDSGEVWKPFRGGASTAQSSHWFVVFTLSTDTERDEIRRASSDPAGRRA